MSKHDISKRKELGQVWTPIDIALEMARMALNAFPSAKNILDPACGPATFSTALKEAGAKNINLTSYDIDSRMVEYTKRVNREIGFQGETKSKDYLTDIKIESSFDIVIMNPPYIRQELIPKIHKEAYHKYLDMVFKGRVDKRANLYALFLLKGCKDLRPGGVMCAIIYDAITQSGYGKNILSLLGRNAELIFTKQIKTPFEGVLVDAQILLYKKRLIPMENYEAKNEKIADGHIELCKLLETRRGTSFPLRALFLADITDPCFSNAKPIFVKQNTLDGLVIKPDESAYMSSQKTDTKVSKWIQKRAKQLGAEIKKDNIKEVKGPIAFNYYIRKAPRHLWNEKNVAISDNFYVSSPKDGFSSAAAWLLLNSELYIERIMSAARNQGNGLLKLQLYEYKQAQIPDWRCLDKYQINDLSKIAMDLIMSGANYEVVRKIASKKTKEYINA